MGLLGLLLPALLPVVTDGIRSLVGRFFGGAGAKPQNVNEAVLLMKAETDRLAVVAQLDQPVGTISPWVADLRASFRYIAAGLIIVMAPVLIIADGAGTIAVSTDVIDTVLSMTGSVFAFLFGDRLWMHMKRDK